MPHAKAQDTPFYEFRFYAVAHGRLPAELALVHDVAVAGAPGGFGSLWDRYGVPRPLGSWTVVSGRRVPGFLYVLGWNSLTERDERFPRFWADPSWRARRAELTDGMTLVDSIETWIMEASPAWASVREEDGAKSVGGLHELRVQHVLNGSQRAAAEALAEVDLPLWTSLGARVLAVLDLVLGPDRPLVATLLAWPDLDTQQRAAERVDGDPRFADRPFFVRTDQHLLRPVAWNMPLPNLGRSA